MTGEMTLRGNILPVGGIKEKVLAAKRSNIKDIVMCEENRKNVMEIKQDYLTGITFHYLKKASEVIPIALCDTIGPNAIDFNKRIEEAQQHQNK
jgi:ATP-dependent Lon protease